MKKRREDMLHFENYVAEIDGKSTFFGVMQQCQEDIIKRWTAVETRKSYYSDYENVLFPLIPEIPLETMTKENFSDIIENVIQQGIEAREPYSPEKINHFKHLIRVVTAAAMKAKICDDVLWGENFREDDTPKHEAQKKIKPKSLSTKEEYQVCDRVLKDYEEDGELVGIAIMYALGTRNQEACGLNWGSFDHPDGDEIGFLSIISSTMIGSNQVQTGGKTQNAPRILPVTGLLLHLLDARKKWIKKELTEKGQTDQESIVKVIADLPIVCRGRDLNNRCSSNDLTRCAKALLQDIHLDEDVLEDINELLEQRFANQTNKNVERDATAYLFRRNFATHMSILGFDPDTIHYLMGHEFDDEEVTKARYTNRDTLTQIGKQMCRRAIINTEAEGRTDNYVLSANESASGTAHGTTHFKIETNGNPVSINCYLKPCGASKLKVGLEYETAPTGQVIISPEKFQMTTEVSEKMTYSKVYQKSKPNAGKDK